MVIYLTTSLLNQEEEERRVGNGMGGATTRYGEPAEEDKE